MSQKKTNQDIVFFKLRNIRYPRDIFIVFDSFIFHIVYQLPIKVLHQGIISTDIHNNLMTTYHILCNTNRTNNI